MEFCWVTLQVKDMEASLRFYRNILDLPIFRRFSVDPVEIVLLGPQDFPKIELISNKNDKSEKHADGISIGFVVSSLEDTMALMRRNNIQITKEPFTESPHIQFCYVKDPDGYDVQFVENK